ncbi:MAG: hypothetical protein ACXVQS_12625 [Actinomycetota bacterium]
MLKVQDIKEVGVGIADKTIGLLVEVTGTLAGNERLKESGRDRQEAGKEKLLAVEEEAKATRRRAAARTEEARQRSHQEPGQRSGGERILSREASPGAAAAERVKGTAKKGLATVTGNEQMKAEADAQQEKADQEAQASKHEGRAALHERKAEAAQRSSERERPTS